MLELHDIHKRYGRKQVLHGLSFALARGEIYGLLGPNGAGKSTALKIVTGLVRPDRGSVTIDGLDLGRDRMPALRQVGAQVDGPAFFGHLSARRNLQLLARVQGTPLAEADRMLERVGLLSSAGDKVEGYSTGMRQRLGIAAALLGSPRLIILDEPTAGVDPQGRQSILETIRALVHDGSFAVLFTSHILEEVARLCDRVGILRQGTLGHEGPVPGAGELRELYFDLSSAGDRP